jgi:hypothetical protein
MPERIYYDLILVGGNEMRVRFDDDAEARRFFDDVDGNRRVPLRWIRVTVVGASHAWWLRTESVVAWSPA